MRQGFIAMVTLVLPKTLFGIHFVTETSLGPLVTVGKIAGNINAIIKLALMLIYFRWKFHV